MKTIGPLNLPEGGLLDCAVNEILFGAWQTFQRRRLEKQLAPSPSRYPEASGRDKCRGCEDHSVLSIFSFNVKISLLHSLSPLSRYSEASGRDTAGDLPQASLGVELYVQPAIRRSLHPIAFCNTKKIPDCSGIFFSISDCVFLTRHL